MTFPVVFRRAVKFSSEAAERKFWEVNDSTEYLDRGKARPAAFPNLKPSTKTISLRFTPALAGRDQGGRECEGRSVSVADQGVAAGEGAEPVGVPPAGRPGGTDADGLPPAWLAA